MDFWRNPQTSLKLCEISASQINVCYNTQFSRCLQSSSKISMLKEGKSVSNDALIPGMFSWTRLSMIYIILKLHLWHLNYLSKTVQKGFADIIFWIWIRVQMAKSMSLQRQHWLPNNIKLEAHSSPETKLTGRNVFDWNTGNISKGACTGWERLIRSHSSARFCFELSGNLN